MFGRGCVGGRFPSLLGGGLWSQRTGFDYGPLCAKFRRRYRGPVADRHATHENHCDWCVLPASETCGLTFCEIGACSALDLCVRSDSCPFMPSHDSLSVDTLYVPGEPREQPHQHPTTYPGRTIFPFPHEDSVDITTPSPGLNDAFCWPRTAQWSPSPWSPQAAIPGPAYTPPPPPFFLY